MIIVCCPKCKTKYRLSDDRRGIKFRCKKCPDGIVSTSTPSPSASPTAATRKSVVYKASSFVPQTPQHKPRTVAEAKPAIKAATGNALRSKPAPAAKISTAAPAANASQNKLHISPPKPVSQKIFRSSDVKYDTVEMDAFDDELLDFSDTQALRIKVAPKQETPAPAKPPAAADEVPDIFNEFKDMLEEPQKPAAGTAAAANPNEEKQILADETDAAPQIAAATPADIGNEEEKLTLDDENDDATQIAAATPADTGNEEEKLTLNDENDAAPQIAAATPADTGNEEEKLTLNDENDDAPQTAAATPADAEAAEIKTDKVAEKNGEAPAIILGNNPVQITDGQRFQICFGEDNSGDSALVVSFELRRIDNKFQMTISCNNRQQPQQ